MWASVRSGCPVCEWTLRLKKLPPSLEASVCSLGMPAADLMFQVPMSLLPVATQWWTGVVHACSAVRVKKTFFGTSSSSSLQVQNLLNFSTENTGRDLTLNRTTGWCDNFGKCKNTMASGTCQHCGHFQNPRRRFLDKTQKKITPQPTTGHISYTSGMMLSAADKQDVYADLFEQTCAG